MRDKYFFRACPLFTGSRNLDELKLPFCGRRNRVDDDPWDAMSEIDDLEAHISYSISKIGEQPGAILPSAPKSNMRLTAPCVE